MSAPVVSGPAGEVVDLETGKADFNVATLPSIDRVPSASAEAQPTAYAEAQQTLDVISRSRYRLHRQLVVAMGDGEWDLYLASDRSLRREVLVRIARVDDPEQLAVVRTRVAWARALARVNDTRITRIYDAVVDLDADGVSVGLIVTDFYPGHQLDHCLGQHDEDGTADAGEVAATIAALRESLETLHEQDLSFGAVQPSDVIITSAGPALVALPVGRASEIGESVLADVIPALRRLCAERDAVVSDDKPPMRRTAREQIETPVTMGVNTGSAAGPGKPTSATGTDKSATAVKAQMTQAGRGANDRSVSEQQWYDEDVDYGPDSDHDDDDRRYDDRGGTPVSGRKRNRFVIVIGVLLGLLGLVVVGWFAGLLLGKVAGGAEDDNSVGGPAPTTVATSAPTTSAGPAAGGAPVKIVGATLFDPPPGDGAENPNDVPLAFDGNPGTFWPTLQYNGSALFGNIKPGVGFIVDLGAETTVSSVKVTTSLPGAKLEIRSGTSADGAGLDAYPVVSPNQTLAADTEFPVAAGTKTRYLLIWLTELVPVQGKFQASISEVAVTS